MPDFHKQLEEWEIKELVTPKKTEEELFLERIRILLEEKVIE